MKSMVQLTSGQKSASMSVEIHYRVLRTSFDAEVKFKRLSRLAADGEGHVFDSVLAVCDMLACVWFSIDT